VAVVFVCYRSPLLPAGRFMERRDLFDEYA
jgi:hypothetical protein